MNRPTAFRGISNTRNHENTTTAAFGEGGRGFVVACELWLIIPVPLNAGCR